MAEWSSEQILLPSVIAQNYGEDAPGCKWFPEAAPSGRPLGGTQAAVGHLYAEFSGMPCPYIAVERTCSANRRWASEPTTWGIASEEGGVPRLTYSAFTLAIR